ASPVGESAPSPWAPGTIALVRGRPQDARSTACIVLPGRHQEVTWGDGAFGSTSGEQLSAAARTGSPLLEPDQRADPPVSGRGGPPHDVPHAPGHHDELGHYDHGAGLHLHARQPAAPAGRASGAHAHQLLLLADRSAPLPCLRNESAPGAAPRALLLRGGPGGREQPTLDQAVTRGAPEPWPDGQ